MIPLTIAAVAAAVNGRVLTGDRETAVTGVTIDSRRVGPGELFVALKGERFDGHDFAAGAIELGAAGVIVSRPLDYRGSNRAVIQVENTLGALQDLARFYRYRFAIPVIGVTGSTGKTTTKDMIAAVLNEAGPALKTGGNFNNEIGLPLTLLQLGPEHWAAVIEMGMRGLGEINGLCRIAHPTLGVITNIGLTHIELLGSTDNIARAKGELLGSLGQEGTAILNGDDPHLRRLGEGFPGRVIYYGLNRGADIEAVGINLEADGSSFLARINLPGAAGGRDIPVSLKVPGRHNVSNALAAVAVGAALNLEPETISRGLRNLALSKMRLEVVHGFRNSSIINDSYNANPTSMAAALEILARKKAGGAGIAVLGDMLELGDWAEAAHRQVGAEAARLGIDHLITVGDLAGDIARGALASGMDQAQIKACPCNQMAVGIVKEVVQPGDVVLVKGSRGMKMEEIVEALKSR